MKKLIILTLVLLIGACTGAPPSGESPFKTSSKEAKPSPTVPEPIGEDTANTQSSVIESEDKYIVKIQDELVFNKLHSFTMLNGVSRFSSIAFTDRQVKVITKDDLNYFIDYTLVDSWRRTIISLEDSEQKLTAMVKDMADEYFTIEISVHNTDQITEIKINNTVFSNKSSKPTTGYYQYTVKPGETLAVLANKFGISVSQIQELNPGLKVTRRGDIIKLPK